MRDAINQSHDDDPFVRSFVRSFERIDRPPTVGATERDDDDATTRRRDGSRSTHSRDARGRSRDDDRDHRRRRRVTSDAMTSGDESQTAATDRRDVTLGRGGVRGEREKFVFWVRGNVVFTTYDSPRAWKSIGLK